MEEQKNSSQGSAGASDSPIMDISAFRIGDTVEVTGIITSQWGWTNSWVHSMDTYVGKIGGIVEVDVRQGIRVVFSTGALWNFPTMALKLANSGVTSALGSPLTSIPDSIYTEETPEQRIRRLRVETRNAIRGIS